MLKKLIEMKIIDGFKKILSYEKSSTQKFKRSFVTNSLNQTIHNVREIALTSLSNGPLCAQFTADLIFAAIADSLKLLSNEPYIMPSIEREISVGVHNNS